MQRSILLLTVFLFCLAACTSALPETTAPTISTTLTSASAQLNRIATQTQAAALTSTVEAQQGAEQPVTPIPTQSPLPVLTQVYEEAGPFQQVSHEEALTMGNVLGLQAVEEGFLLFSEGGISYFKDNLWTGYFTQEMGYPVGADAAGRSWVVAVDGSQIYRDEQAIRNRDPYDDTIVAWIVFRPEDGWIPITNTIGSPVNFGLLTDSDGGMWVATQEDIRLFNGAWQVFDSQSLGMPPPSEGTSPTFTLYPDQKGGVIYAGRCDWGSAGPVGGGGLRVFDGSVWTEPDPALHAGCVTAITQESSGNLWVAQDANLWFYNSASSTWE